MNDQELLKQGYIRIEQFCRAMDTWARVCQQESHDDSESKLQWRKDFSEHWEFIRLAIAKSCLLDRLIYGGEKLRVNQCPVHKGHWSGCDIDGTLTCGCGHDSCITGWLPNSGDPKLEASFTVRSLSRVPRDMKG
jgi:hypothetical protein